MWNKEFLDLTPKTQVTKGKTNKIGLHQNLKNF